MDEEKQIIDGNKKNMNLFLSEAFEQEKCSVRNSNNSEGI